MDCEEAPSERVDCKIRPALRFNNPAEERLKFAKQLEVSDVIVHPYAQSYLPDEDLPLSTDTKWSFEELLHLRTYIEERGLRLGAIENFPLAFYDEIMLGGDGREEQLENLRETIQNVGRAGIDTIGYNWMPNRVWRSSLTLPGRGGATSTAFDMDEMKRAPLTHDREYTEAEMWENYEYFLERVLPVAEEAGVTLSLHPDDPPVPSLGGVARLFGSFDRLRRAMDVVPSPRHKIQLGLGVFSEMKPEVPVEDMVRHFARENKISYVHFRDVEGRVPRFREVFLNEGNYDEYAVLKALIEEGFEGMVIPDHVPKMEAEAEWGPSGRAFTIGYIQGMLKAYEDVTSSIFRYDIFLWQPVGYADMSHPENRIAIVTGASSGIGRGIALRLAEAGLSVVVADLQRSPKQGKHYDTDVVKPTDELIREEFDGESLFVETDVTTEQAVRDTIDSTVNEFDHLDVLINNAGILIPGDTQELSRKDWQQQLDVNLSAYFLMAKYAIPHITKSTSGRIVNISSVNAHFGGAGPAYAATKAGIVNLTRDLATEVAEDSVTVNAVLPGVIKTPMQDLNDAETMKRQANNTPLTRLGEPRDIANAVQFFVSEEAEWITGSQLLVDGGYLAGGY